MKLFLIFFFNFICFNNSSFIPNINDLASKEFNNYQKILEIQKIPCYIQTIRIKTFNSAFQKKKKI